MRPNHEVAADKADSGLVGETKNGGPRPMRPSVVGDKADGVAGDADEQWTCGQRG